MIEKTLDQALMQIQAQLIVPVIIGYMLRGLEPFDDIAEYTMEDMIGSMWPDSALLTIAFSAKHISNHHAHLPIAAALGIESSRIIADYAPIWIANSQNIEGASEQEIKELLLSIPEDLEALADLMDATSLELTDTASVAKPLCDILSSQAQSHKCFAEYKLDTLGVLESEIRYHNSEKSITNVISFPGTRH